MRHLLLIIPLITLALALILRGPTTMMPQEQLYTWDGSQVLQVDSHSLKPIPPAISWPVVGGGE